MYEEMAPGQRPRVHGIPTVHLLFLTGGRPTLPINIIVIARLKLAACKMAAKRREQPQTTHMNNRQAA